MPSKKLFFHFLIIVAVMVYGCAPQPDPQEPQMQQPPIAPQPPAVQEPPLTSPTQEPSSPNPAPSTVVPVIANPKPVVAENKKFQVFNPTLKYPGAYNGPLYATSEQVGSASMDSYFENLDRNGINFFIGMFGISGEPTLETLVSNQGLGEVISAVQKHPHRVIPFFNPGIGGEEIEDEGYLQKDLIKWYKATLGASKKIVGNDFFMGFGEIETQEWKVRHNDPKIIELVEVAKANKISVMFHPVAGKISDVEKIIEAYPNTIFLIHMYREDLDKSMSQLIKILQEHNNLYFSMDAAHILFDNSLGGDLVYVFDSSNRESSIKKFTSTYDSKEKAMISSAITAYKPLVDAAPDKVMWGTEIGPEYAFDRQVFDRAVKISRLVIAGFAPEHQEAVGYKNALRVFGEGVTMDRNIMVLDTASWSDCSESQMSDCDESCEIPDSDVLTAEQEACFSNCLIEDQCKEVLEMDIG